MAELLDRIVERIRRAGPLRFDHFVTSALYDTEFGFFAVGSGAGRSGGDFLTSPEVGPLFGHLVARQLDRLWIEAGRPTSFDVVEVAAGRGALAIAVRAADPECSPALRYHLVERSAELRRRHGEFLPLVEGGGLEGAGFEGAGVEGAGFGVQGRHGEGPEFVSHPDLSGLGAAVDVVFANELLDNVPFRVVERVGATWNELYVGVGVDLHVDAYAEGDGASLAEVEGDGASLAETLVPLSPDDDIVATADRLVPDAPDGSRIPIQSGAVEWLAEALDLVRVPGGVVISVDYCRPTPELARLDWSQWVRTYRDHGRGAHVLVDPGLQDITCDVALDQLFDYEPWSANVSQAEWLIGLGISELVDEGRNIWNRSSSAPDLSAIMARSRISEAEALCDESGLGGFRVLTWNR